MTPRTVLILLALAVVFTAGGVYSVVSRPELTAATIFNEPAFPALRAAPEAVTAITVHAAGRRFLLERDAEGDWRSPDRAGYPVSAERVRRLIVGLSDLRLVEPKTAREQRFVRLQLDDPDAEGSRSRHVVLVDGSGGTVAEAWIGRRHWRPVGGQQTGTYLRRPGDDHAWLASGAVDLEPGLVSYLEPALLGVAPTDLAAFEFVPDDSPAWAIRREQPDGPFVMEAVPEGRELRQDFAEGLPVSFANLRFADVAPRAEQTFDRPPDRTARLATFDGTVIDVAVWRDDQVAWVTFDASAPAAGGSAPDPAAVAAAEAINARLGEWTYRFPYFTGDRMAPPAEQYLVRRATS